MENGLKIQLLGNFHLVYDGKAVSGLESPRLQSLLTYLLLNRDSPVQRQHLSYTFWPDSSDSQARTNLRNLIFRLREAFPEADQFLDVETQTLWWNPDLPFKVDLDRFEEAVKDAEDANQDGDAIKYLQALEDAAAGYGGDLLPSCYDDWIIPEREHLSQAYIRVLEELVDVLEADQDYTGAIKIAQRLLHQDPLHETTYRLLMELHALNGDTARALRVFHTCVENLEKELGVEPNPATLELYQGLLDRDLEGEKHPRITEKGSKLVGREEPYKKMQKIWRQLGDQSQLVLITGEAGIGKTYLAEAFTRWTRKQGVSNLKTRCYATEGELSYTPLIALLRNESTQNSLRNLENTWLVELSRLLPELKETVPDLPDPDELSESWQRGRMFEACARALLGGGGKVVISLDDLHWCDGETLDWLRFLMDYDSGSQLIALATIRSENLLPDSPLSSLIIDLKQKEQLTEIELENLDLKTTITLAANLWGDTLDDPLAARLFQETEGNPLFVVELVRSGYLKEDLDQEEKISLPPKIQAVIEARLAGLSPQTRELSSLAAVVGRDFNYELLCQAGDVEDEVVLQALDELWQRRVIHDQGENGYDFSHEKFREVILGGLSPHRRTHFHLKIAQSLEGIHAKQLDRAASQLGFHFQQSGKSDRAVDYYLLAGDQARRVYAREDAVFFYQQAAALIGDQKDPRLIQIHEGWGNALLKLARYQEAAEAYQKMGLTAKTVKDKKAQAQAWLALGKVQDRQGIFLDAITSAEKALQLAAQQNLEEELADAHLLIGQGHYRLGEAESAEKSIKEAMDIHRKRKDQFAVGRCLNLLGLAHDVRGDFQAARQYKEQAIQEFEDIEGRHSIWWIGNITLNLANSANLGGEYQQSVDLYLQAMGIMEEIGDRDWNVLCLFNLGGARVGLGEYQQAEVDLKQVLELTRGSDWLGLSLTNYFLAESYLGQGEVNKAGESAVEALKLANETGSNEFLGAAWRALGKVASGQKGEIELDGKELSAQECFQNSIDIYQEAGAEGERAYTLKAWALHELDIGDKDQGEKIWLEAKEIFTRLEMKAELARMDKTLQS